MKNNKALNGKEYWRSLDQLEDTPEFRQFLEREFPQGASEMTNKFTRRNFLTLMGASLALAGLAGCRRPVEKIIPYVNAPEEIVPGIAKHYATTMPFGNSAYGLLVESHEGRPTKIEGNPNHPSTLGSANMHLQAEMLNLYDPDRLKVVKQSGEEKSWQDFVDWWKTEKEQLDISGGKGLAVISEPYSSPTISRLVAEFKQQYPNAVWVTYEPISNENLYNGIELAVGQKLQPVYKYENAHIILALDSDFLSTESENITATRGFSAGRHLNSERDEMNRLYVVESNFSLTGAMADHRLRLQRSQIAAFSAALANELIAQGLQIDLPNGFGQANESLFDKKWLKVLASDLIKNQGSSLLVAGRSQPAEVHALVYYINDALGNIGKSVGYNTIEFGDISNTQKLSDLTSAMNNSEIESLVIIGGNPLYDSPADLKFKSALKKIKKSVHLSTHLNETSEELNWQIPQTHFLENWGDTRAVDGTLSVIQPLIEPLYDAHSIVEFLTLLSTGKSQKGYRLVRQTWQERLGNNFEKRWKRVVHDGLLKESRSILKTPKVNINEINKALSAGIFSADVTNNKLEVVFQASMSLHDGRYANNGWLQECPDPISKIVWDNAALLSPRTAMDYGVNSKDLIQLSFNGRNLELPVWIVPGQADNSITLELGYGRSSAGRVGDKVGFDVYPLRSLNTMYAGIGAKINSVGKQYEISNTQDHSSLEGRAHFREASISDYRQHPNFAQEMVEHPPLESLWNEHSYKEGYQWGMTIDLNRCIGCNACVIACQSENNIPVIGKEQVGKGREMHWLRIDRYFTGDIDEPEMALQPVMCQHCENAPCEQVCPVAATVHDKEGLNVMVYNRCIGTRYCSNNCPYKVRRFNFFNYTKDLPETVKMAQNPDVTVRSRGVMEKCTYCTQRISKVKQSAKKENRQVNDGEIVTACQQACPASAITFGNINENNSKVTREKKLNRNYAMLSELNIKPRTTYLAKIRNPHPELERKPGKKVSSH